MEFQIYKSHSNARLVPLFHVFSFVCKGTNTCILHCKKQHRVILCTSYLGFSNVSSQQNHHSVIRIVTTLSFYGSFMLDINSLLLLVFSFPLKFGLSSCPGQCLFSSHWRCMCRGVIAITGVDQFSYPSRTL